MEYYKYVQKSNDDRILAIFGDEDMIWKNFNPQNFSDSMGYCMSLLELSILNVTNHMSVESYNANFFTHGYAARGILHLKGSINRAQLKSFQRQFYNTISGANNAWRTPIIGGLDEIEWIPLSGTAKEMEYLSYDNHLIRAICSQFLIDPIEIGLEVVSSGATGSSQQANNEYKITHSKEKGLIPILMFFEDFINENIIKTLDSDLNSKYLFKFVGYTDETPQTQIAQLQAEMTVYSSLNDLLKAAEKTQIEHPVADLPMNEAFWNIVEKNLTRGEIREIFLGDKGAAKRPELQYIPADPAFLQWQQMIMTIVQQKEAKEQLSIQAQQQQEEMQHKKDLELSQEEREKDAHELEMNEKHASHAHNIVNNQRSFQEIGKQFGVGDEPANIEGRSINNPINNPDLD
jgi:hypothetical protein